MAARRVVPVSNDNKTIGCPTGDNSPVDYKEKTPALSNEERRRFDLVAKPGHESMSRMLGYCLTLGTADAWSGFSLVAAARLSETERAALAFAALNALELDHAEMAAAASIGTADLPLPSFLGGMAEARFWASCASRSELKAFALASFEAMNPEDQTAFFRHVDNNKAAA